MPKEVSAGGIAWRRSATGAHEVLMIEDQYGRWTFPKGRVEPGETAAQAAEREIFEETGIKAECATPLGEVNYFYRDARGTIDKTVHYFLARAQNTDITPATGEISAAAWVPVAEAPARCQYENNRAVLERAIKALKEGKP